MGSGAAVMAGDVATRTVAGCVATWLDRPPCQEANRTINRAAPATITPASR